MSAQLELPDLYSCDRCLDTGAIDVHDDDGAWIGASSCPECWPPLDPVDSLDAVATRVRDRSASPEGEQTTEQGAR